MAKTSVLGFLFLALFLNSCETAPFNSGAANFRRNWVRRVAPESSLTKNSSSQKFSPVLMGKLVVQGSTFGGIKTFSQQTGQVKWSIQEENGVSSHGQVSNGKLFYGSYDGKAKAYKIKDRAFAWSVSLDSSPITFSKVSNGKVFVLTDVGTLYSLSEDNGAILWSVKKPSQKPLQVFGGASPALYKDQVISSFPDGSVVSYSQNTGKQKWSVKFDSYQKFEDVDFLVLEDNYLFAGSFDEALYSLNPENGSIRWRVMQGPVSSVSIDGSRVYYSSNKGELISLEKSSGKIVFQKSFLKGLGNRPSVVNDLLVVSDSKGPIYITNKNTGEVVTTYNSGTPVSSDFVIDQRNDKIYFLSNKGNLFKFGIDRSF